ncbi:uroporphyrinogen decarboxylase [Chryseobacterium sp. JK1]|uniref:uroporphyrinogen decarboxylase n=1 Tax=Chryseobacterium sp. JK1 TaxID=874294 RepID=UPI003D696031
MNSALTTYIGYSASVFIVLSFILKDVRKIRVVNMIGCICFVIYGIFNGWLWPVIIPNGLICFIQIYYLITDKKDS